MSFIPNPVMTMARFEQDQAESSYGGETIEIETRLVANNEKHADGGPDRYWVIKTGPEGWSFDTLADLLGVLRKAGCEGETP